MALDEAALVALIGASEPEQVALGRAQAGAQAQAFDTLSAFLRARKGELAALDVAAGVVRGIAAAAPLEPHRDIYRDLLGADMDPQSIRPQPIKTLALSLAMPNQDYWVRLHGRRLLRRVWELRDARALSPDVVDALVGAGVAWELGEVDTLDEVWQIVLALCTTEEVDVVPIGRCPNVREHLAGGTVVAGDAAVAGFLRAHPGVFETSVLDRIDELAAMPSHDRSYSVLAQLFDTLGMMGPSKWRATHAAWDATLGLRLWSQAILRGLLDPGTQHNSFHVARAWLERDPAGYDGLPREMVDVFRGLIAGTPLPEILPPELDQQSPEQIEQALAAYCGITLEQLYARLLPGGLSAGGFIQPTTHLGQLIFDDAETLRSLGISRHELADRIAELIPPPDGQWHQRGPFQCSAMAFMGHQHDPFHVYDVYGLNGHLGSIDFRIVRGDRELAGGNLQLSLIRRACLFGGPGCYRIDPARAAELLQLR